METITTGWLQSIEPLSHVPADQLQWMIDNSRHYEMKEGEYLINVGESIVGTHIVVTGRIKLLMYRNQERAEMNVIGPKEISGYLPFSRGLKAKVDAKVVADAQLMTLPTEKFREMISKHYELTEALVHVMTTRVRDFTSLQQQNEKMMALGKLSAGLAHELNNPAAAIVRGSASLLEHFQLEPEAFKKVMSMRIEEKDVDLVSKKLFEVLGRQDKNQLPLMERTEREDRVRDWLEDQEVEEADEIAENLVDFGFTGKDLEDFKEHIPARFLSAIFGWINSNLVTKRMVTDIQESSQRISDLVKSVKNFTHMDQGKGKEATDIHSGIRNTLTMLHYRFKKGNIELIEEFDETLPKIPALVGELNQVWTNVIDNALDAMEPARKGQLTIRTETDHEYVKISIIDNGPGIPADIQSRIFDPFYTTKEIGKGTGLGLDVVTRIVRQHSGSVKVQSVPGRTAFVLCFPIK
jgi:signal transduction histidine kinase